MDLNILQMYAVVVLGTPEERRLYAQLVWALIVSTYKEYGNSEDGRLYGAQLEDLIKGGKWMLVMDGEKLIAGVIFKDYKGNKTRLVLHDNTREGKDALKALFIGEFLGHRCWGECSGHLERILLEAKAPTIPNTRAAEILKPAWGIAELDPDGMHYKRAVFEDPVTKELTVKREMLFGTVE